MLRARKQHLILIRMIDAPQGIDQFSSIPSDPDVGIFEMPGGDNDLHNVVGFQAQRRKTDCPLAAPYRERPELLDGMSSRADWLPEFEAMEPQRIRQVKTERAIESPASTPATQAEQLTETQACATDGPL